ncbi:MAG: GNAT family N-acetyltransferase [Bacteroidota bacterium]
MYLNGFETKRLNTRCLTVDDIPAWTEYFQDKVGTTFIPNDTQLQPEERAAEWITITMDRYVTYGTGLQALITKDAGVLVGICGVLRQEVKGKIEFEIGYHLLRRYWGMGYATEAARRFRDYAFENNIAESLISIIHPLNFLSQNVAMRNGMKLSERGIIWRNREYDVYRITRAEWELQR